MADYVQMKKAELNKALARLKDQDSPAGSRLQRALHDLEVYQEELEVQNAELREAQEALERSRDRYAQLYDFSPVGYLSLDDAGCMQELNLTAAAMLGADRARLIGKPFGYYVAPPARQQFFFHLRECRRGRARVNTELALKSGSGLPRAVELISVRAPDAEEGKVLFRTAMTDITERKRAAQALQESESRSRWLIENMPAVLWTQDQKGGPRYISANVVGVLGYTEQEVRSGGARFWVSNVHPDDRQRVEAAYARLFSGEGAAAYDIEYRRQAKDGSWVWVVDKGMTITEQGGVRYATGMFWDTTRRKRMQEQLRESEERFRQLAENIDEVFYLAEIQRDEFYYVSPAFEAVWGFPGDTLYRRPRAWQDAIHPEDRAQVRRVLKARQAEDPYEVEFRITRPDGAVRWIRARGFPIPDPSGRPYRVAGIAEDITARKEAAGAQELARARLQEFGTYLESAREEERKRIAREIHDELGAMLLAVKIDLDAWRKSEGPAAPGLAAAMEELMGRVDAAIEAVRRIATALRPSVLDHVGVLAAVEWQAQDVERRTGIKCEVVSDSDQDDMDLDPPRATAVFRIVQEALTNIVRHSKASHASIALHNGPDGVEVRITDDGMGFDTGRPPAPHSWGLVGMAERVRGFGGRFSVTSTLKRGTAISVVIPRGAAGRGRRARRAASNS